MLIVVAIAGPLMASSADAQQPTPAAPVNPNWCSEVPASPAPPEFERRFGSWDAIRKSCSSGLEDIRTCSDLCLGAQELWAMKKSGNLGKSRVTPSTDKLQGPFPLPGGGNEYILPAFPTHKGTTSNDSSDSGIGPPSAFSGSILDRESARFG